MSSRTPSAKDAPRISANKLGEYLVSTSPVRRRRIVTDQKDPNSAIVPRYRQALEPMAAYLTSHGENEDVIHNAIENLRTEGGSEWVVNDNRNTADALECFLQVSEHLLEENVTYLRAPEHPPKLLIGGVNVSVRPDLLLQFERKGKLYSGALKFHFIRNVDHALGEEGGKYVGTILHRWLEQFGDRNRKPDPKHCIVVDCFRKQIIEAPAGIQRRLQNIEAACQEIAMQWAGA